MKRATIVRKNKTVSLFYSPLVYKSGFADRVVRVLNKVAPSLEAYILPGKMLGGKIANSHNGEIMVNIKAPSQYPLKLRRGWAFLKFENIRSSATFALLHEIGHILFGGDQENAADIWAIAIQTDFDLAPPEIAERKPRKLRPRLVKR